MTYQSLNPATGKLIKVFEQISDDQLEAKLAAAAECFAVWRHKAYAERAAIVGKVAGLMLEHKEALPHCIRPSAKPIWKAVRLECCSR
jgi:succinate-semialdehyde dehydrogenase/glutarate-semialdehyde dehydrogenase